MPPQLSRFAVPPRVVFREAEDMLLQRRAQPPDMNAAISCGLAEALGSDPPAPGVVATGHAIAAAVTDHAASFGLAGEPAYHDQRHQAEATVAMGWLCASAVRHAMISPGMAAVGVLAMAGHDLQHDGSWSTPGLLEVRSAELTVALGSHVGLDAATLAIIRRVILATNPVRPEAERNADDLLCRLAQEADLFGSLTPALGWQLSHDLARETEAAGHRFDPPIASFAGRLALIRGCRPITRAGRELGLADTLVDQVAAMAVHGDGDADRGAAALDALQPERARADYAAALMGVAPV